jgi:hypothetical protein
MFFAKNIIRKAVMAEIENRITLGESEYEQTIAKIEDRRLAEIKIANTVAERETEKAVKDIVKSILH